MTSTTGTTQHPDVSEISDLTEGLLSPSRTTDVRRHVADCELCSDVLASLEEIRDLLGSAPAPQAMPADIADRIDAALAEEARSAATAAPAAADVSREAVDVSRETEHSTTTQDLIDRPAGHSRAATGPGRRPVRRRRRNAVIGAALGAAVVSVSVLLLQNLPSSQSSSDTSAADRSAASKTESQTFSQTTLEDRVHSLLSSHPDSTQPRESSGENETPSLGTKSSPETAPPGSATPQTPLRAPVVSVPSCIEQGIGRNSAALAIEKGTYEGTDAFLVVLPHPTDTTRVEAYVVDAACVGADPGAKGKLLLTHAYPRR
ncbi:hypothetical protein AB0N93_07650 [Streptomyces sp. NPDC091267]|uniref:anti-sigma factor family protein n=1 Tax=unclassified Streptomyces TaxID=2593676 RepID=UPI003430F67B